MSKSKKLEYGISSENALKKLEKAINRLGGTDLEYGHAKMGSEYRATISFKVNGSQYKFEYSTEKAKYFKWGYARESDILNALIQGLSQLALMADRGVFDFTRIISGYKELPHIDLPPWAKFMGFQTIPMSFSVVQERYRDLLKGPMNNEKNPEGFMALRDAMRIAALYFGIKQSEE